MTPATFLKNFEYVVNAPFGVSRLREMIYNLAIGGSLSQQMEEDGTGLQLLEQLSQIKENGIDNGTFKRSSKLEAANIKYSDSLPRIPRTWAWARLVDIGEINPRNEAEDDSLASFAPMNVISELHNCPVRFQERSWSTIKKGFTHFAEGDVMVAKITPCFENGKGAVLRGLKNGIGAGTTELHVVRPLLGVLPEFIYIFLRSPHFKIVGESHMTGTAGQKRLSTEYFALRPFPLPPLEEQKRIVAKVDELMRLCDRLEAQQQEREKLLPLLSRANHARFVAEPTPGNLKAIFHQPGRVYLADLRVTVLTLAVKGKLVAQNAGDSPLKDTCSGIESTTHVQTSVPAPSQWIAVKYRNLTSIITSGSRSWKQFYSSSGAVFVRTQNIKTDMLLLDDVAYVNLPKTTEGQRTQVRKGDILVTITGANVNKAALVTDSPPEAYVSQHIALTRPRWRTMAEWLHLCFVSPGAVRGDLERLAYGDKPGLNLDSIRELVIPLPPLAEQRRILSRVHELIALCDRLEAQVNESRQTVETFSKAAVAAITTTEFTENERMKPPKTEVVTALKITMAKPKKPDVARLRVLLAGQKDETSAKRLWQLSGLDIDDFYRQLKTEIANGWITEDLDKRAVQEVEAT